MAKGRNLVKVPGELYSPTPGGVVTSADGVKDYRLNKNQEQINQELTESVNEAVRTAEQAASSASSMENVVARLREQGEQDIATALEHESRIESNEEDISTLKGQLGDVNIVILTEEEYEELVLNNQLDPNTLYFTSEENSEET